MSELHRLWDCAEQQPKFSETNHTGVKRSSHRFTTKHATVNREKGRWYQA
jgi:hypothetical protein